MFSEMRMGAFMMSMFSEIRMGESILYVVGLPVGRVEGRQGWGISRAGGASHHLHPQTIINFFFSFLNRKCKNIQFKDICFIFCKNILNLCLCKECISSNILQTKIGSSGSGFRQLRRAGSGFRRSKVKMLWAWIYLLYRGLRC